MRPRVKSLSTPALQLLTFSIIAAAALPAGVRNESSGDNESTPQLSVRVYSFPGLSAWLLNAAEVEATDLLRNVPVGFNWVDCTSRLAPAACVSDLAPTDLVVRVLPKALPQVSANVMGIAGSSSGMATAFIFYDRMLSVRTQARPLPSILGRVMAHEITHLLLPPESHSDFGLMRGQWSGEDLQMGSFACMGLPSSSVRLMQKEAVRRVQGAQSRSELISQIRDRRSQ